MQVDPALEKLDLAVRELKVREKSSRDAGRLREERAALEGERDDRRRKAKRGEMILRKGSTTFRIPSTATDIRGARGMVSWTLKGAHRTAFAFEIHSHDFANNGGGLGGSNGGSGSNGRVLTVCCDSHKGRRAFIRTLQNALVTRAEVERMRNQYVTDDAVRERHRRMGQKRLGNLTLRITESLPSLVTRTMASSSSYNLGLTSGGGPPGAPAGAGSHGARRGGGVTFAGLPPHQRSPPSTSSPSVAVAPKDLAI